ncbi:12577_t:CDS:1, partial [Gigaspora rosea]
APTNKDVRPDVKPHARTRKNLSRRTPAKHGNHSTRTLKVPFKNAIKHENAKP